MLRAATCPWRSATTQCSTRIRSPERSIRPAGHVARGKDSRHACFEILVHGDTAVQRQACLFGKSGHRTDSDTKYDEVGVQRRAVAQRRGLAVDPGDRLTEVEHDTVCFVQRLNEASDLLPHDTFERHALRRDHIHSDAPRSE